MLRYSMNVKEYSNLQSVPQVKWNYQLMNQKPTRVIDKVPVLETKAINVECPAATKGGN